MSVKCDKCGHTTRQRFCCMCGTQVDGDSTILQWISACESRIMTWDEKLNTAGDDGDAAVLKTATAKLAMWRKRKQILEDCQKGKPEPTEELS